MSHVDTALAGPGVPSARACAAVHPEPGRPGTSYDPEFVLARDWPEVVVRSEEMDGWLLGELCYPLITVRAGTSAAQRRCTLTHELIHLERGVRDCGPWAQREEEHVDREVARRLVPTDALVEAVRALGELCTLRALARELAVDTTIMSVRLQQVTADERRRIRRHGLPLRWLEA